MKTCCYDDHLPYARVHLQQFTPILRHLSMFVQGSQAYAGSLGLQVAMLQCYTEQWAGFQTIFFCLVCQLA